MRETEKMCWYSKQESPSVGANLITHCLFPAPFPGKLLLDRLHSQLQEYTHLWDAKNEFRVLEQTFWEEIFLSSQLCSEQDVQDVCGTAHVMELGLIKKPPYGLKCTVDCD